jgi:pimeloyl-ACP methyl ester carboxylesterase
MQKTKTPPGWRPGVFRVQPQTQREALSQNDPSVHMELTPMPLAPIDTRHLPAGVHSRFVESVNGLRIHLLEAGHETPGQPLLLLLHGFPEIAYSWRKVIVPLAELGYHVVAPDQRGYGRTTGWSATYEQDLRPYSMLNLARDAVALTFALGYRQAAAVVGHDFGAPVAAWCALTRPDVYQRCAILSAPFAGAPSEPSKAFGDVEADLERMARPRKHYQRYYTTRSANDDMWCAPEGVGAFLRAYFHSKSADWTGNAPHPLAGFSADELAKMPTYYVMDRDQTMAETVRPFAPSATEIARNQWLPDAEMAVYAEEYARTGFQGGLNWYRASLEPQLISDHTLFSGKAIDVPSMFIAGQSDWGTYQAPGALDTMRERAFTHMTDVCLVPGAGHWVQQEQHEAVIEHLQALLSVDA